MREMSKMLDSCSSSKTASSTAHTCSSSKAAWSATEAIMIYIVLKDVIHEKDTCSILSAGTNPQETKTLTKTLITNMKLTHTQLYLH